MQACIDHVPSHALSTPSRPALPTAALLSVCRSDGGSIRVCPYPATVMAAALRQLARIPMPAAGPGQQLQGCRVGAQGDGCLAALLGQLQHALLPRDASGVSDGSHGSDKDGRIHHSGGGCMADAHTHGSAASSSIGMHTSEVISQRTVQGTADDRACADAHSRPGPRAACRPHDR